MQVFVATEKDVDHFEQLVGVFSTEKEAEKALEPFKAPFIYEVTLNKPIWGPLTAL